MPVLTSTRPREAVFQPATAPPTPQTPPGDCCRRSVHEPCQHQRIRLGCECASCLFSGWAARQEPDLSATWWEPQALADVADPVVRHRYFLWVYVLLVVFALTSHTVENLFQLLFDLMMLAANAGTFVASILRG